MKLESLTPHERIAYVASQRLHGAPLDRFSVLSTTSIQQVCDPLEPAIQKQLRKLLGPVFILEAFAEAIGNKLRGTGQVYVLGDSAVIRLAEDAGLVPEQSWSMHLETLACTGLIFRFPVALKFDYTDPLITQLRSNSWGNLISNHERSSSAFHNVVVTIESAIEKHLECYVDLVNACRSDIRPLDVKLIHALNERVPIPIVT